MAVWRMSWSIIDMPPPTRTAALVVLAVLVTTVLSGAQPGTDGRMPRATPTSAASATSATSAASAAEGFRTARTYPTVAAPVRLRIPELHVNSSLLRLGRARDGTIEVPKRYDVAGWYRQGPRPGQPGPAVIVGHVDSKADGPGVFFNLYRLKRGTAILVDRADGSTVTFAVTRVERHPKDAFPTDAVYGPTADAQLRLVTCGGDFDRSVRSYEDNVVVFARVA
jgi:sortase (surface protein transpeptidase)